MQQGREGRHSHAGHGGQGDHRGHGHFHHMDDEHAGHGGGHNFRGGRGEGPGGFPFGGPRDRARRGDARYVLLDALRDGPKHGYEIIKALEERSSGQYSPSPGTVYPTMQYLEDLGQVRSDQGGERRVYHLTDAGQAELEARANDIAAFWARFGSTSDTRANQPEIAFLREELHNLEQTIRSGVRGLSGSNINGTIRRVRQAVESCRNDVRTIIAESVVPQDGTAGTKPME